MSTTTKPMVSPKISDIGIDDSDKALEKLGMTREHFDKEMRKVYLGETTQLPDGRDIADVHKSILKFENQRIEDGINAKPEPALVKLMNPDTEAVKSSEAMVENNQLQREVDLESEGGKPKADKPKADKS